MTGKENSEREDTEIEHGRTVGNTVCIGQITGYQVLGRRTRI